MTTIPTLPNRRLASLLACLLFPLACLAQLDAGTNDTINAGVPVTLTATYGLTGDGITISDDGVEGPFPIGFPFSFFGDIYYDFYVGANGWLSFSPNPNAAGTREAFAVPNAADYNPKNCVLGPFQDLNPIMAGSPYIFYKTIGTNLNRRLVVMWCQTPMYGCSDSASTFQIVLVEGTNAIESHMLKKPSCAWNNNLATLGVQNLTGYKGFAAPGKNASSWTASMESWQFTPTSADSFRIMQVPYNLQPIIPGEKVAYAWYQGNDLIGNSASIVVTPRVTTTYTVRLTLCDGQEFEDSVEVYVLPNVPNAFTPNHDGLNDRFTITGLPVENITEFNLQVFNRWGQLVFSTSDILDGWDGTYKGQPCPEGNYVWVIFYKDGNRNKVTNKGMVLLLK